MKQKKLINERLLTDLGGKGVLISGGTTGIGKKLAYLLCEAGAKVFIFGRNEKVLGETLKEIQINGGKIFGTVADQTNPADIQRVFGEFDLNIGKLDILINNASVGARSINETKVEDIEYIVKANLLGYMLCSKLAIERMKTSKTGHIVMVGSMSAEETDEGASVYVATKAAVRGLAKSLRKELNQDGIKVTLIETGNVSTDMVTETLEQRREMEKEGLMLRSEDVASAIYFSLIQPPQTDIISIQLKPRNQKF